MERISRRPSPEPGLDDPATYARNVENFAGTVRVPRACAPRASWCAARAAAHALGATRAISALQHDGSVARALSAHAIPFRRYAVLAKELS